MGAQSLEIKIGLYMLAAGVGLCARPALAQKELSDYAQPALKDLTASVKLLSHNNRELSKMGKGFAELYKLESREIWCKEPSCVRVQGKKGIMTLRSITNGDRRKVEVPTMRIRKVENVKDEPGKADSISDLGVITPAWLRTVQSRWLRTETRDGKPHHVFEFWHPEDSKAKHTIVLDPATKTVVEHIAHHRAQRKKGFKRRVVYSEPKQVNGVWIPTRAAAYSPDNKLAGEVRYDKIQINTGLPDSLFKI
jgi:hypothetical protein